MALGPTAHRGGREATDSSPYTYLCTPSLHNLFFRVSPACATSSLATCAMHRGKRSVAVAGMMPAQEEADGSFRECIRESRGRGRPRERGNHGRRGLSTAAERSPAPGGGRLRWPAPGGRKAVGIGPGLGTAPEVEAGTISASALSHRSRAVPQLPHGRPSCAALPGTRLEARLLARPGTSLALLRRCSAISSPSSEPRGVKCEAV